MMRLKRALAVLGVSGLMIGLIALYAGSSQAEKGASWMVNGAKISATLLPTVSLEVDTGPMALLTELGGKPVELACQQAQFIGAALETEGRVKPGNKTKFSECVMKSGGKVIPSCEPGSGSESGTFTSNGLTGLIVLHELAGGGKETLIRFEPSSPETPFAVIQLGEECAFGETCTVTGVSYVRDGGGEFAVNKIKHLVEQQKSLSKLLVGGSPASVDGSAWVYLAGAHAGMTWSAQAG